MIAINETEFRRVLELALARGDIKIPLMVELVASYLVTGVACSIDERYHIYHSYHGFSDIETHTDNVLFGLETRSDSEWILRAYENLLSKYPSPQPQNP